MHEISLLPAILNVKNGTAFTGIRLNLVGGETFLYKQQVLNIIQEARKHGFELSAITNGSSLDQDLITIIATQFSTIGFSIDSLSDKSNLEIGRSFKNNFDFDDKIFLYFTASVLNERIFLKGNRFVCSSRWIIEHYMEK